MTRLSSPHVSASLSGDTVQMWPQRATLVAGGGGAGLRARLAKDYLINRIISPSILSQSCDNVKGEQGKQPIYVYLWNFAIPPAAILTVMKKNQKTKRRFASEEVSCAPCQRLPSVVFFQHLTDDTVGHGEVFIILAHADARVIHLFIFFITGLYRYACWTQLLHIIITRDS